MYRSHIMSTVKPATASKSLVAKFNALGDKTRYRLLELLINRDDICVSELAQEVSISNAGVSQQLKIMEQAGIIVRKRDGQKICYQVDRSDASNQQLLEMLGE